jgi:flagellar hook-associated protein 1 FlgK
MTGLAGRIEINAAVDPSAGGAAWRLRDGLTAATPGAEGNGVYLQALSDAMAAAREPIGFVSQNARAGGALMASEIASFLAGMAARSDDDRAYLTARQSTLAEQESHLTGVDSDAELESLMLVEQTYAANARVLSVIDELMKLLLEV